MIQDVELYDSDENEVTVPDGPWASVGELQHEGAGHAIDEEEMRRRRFPDEGQGPPYLTDDGLAQLDTLAMLAEF